ncbi:MAG: hypothetical protein WAV23_02800 [Minisyncoccia bacterium]
MKTKNKEKEKTITIEAELAIPLGELAIYLLVRGQDEAEVNTVLYQTEEKANKEIRKIAKEVLIKKKSEVKLKYLKFDYNDSDKISHGVAYFKVKIEGTEKALRKIAGEDRIFEYDWEEHNKTNINN